MPDFDPDAAISARKRRPPPIATPAHLRTVAEAYVQRFFGPAANLRRVLLRHVDRSVREHGTDRGASLREIELIVGQFAESKLLDDRRFAELAARTLHGRGRPRQVIGMQLRAKGLGEADVGAALANLDTEALSDRDAAWALARRRRLGPYRRIERKAFREKDLQAIARAGFSFSLAREVVDAAETDAAGEAS